MAAAATAGTERRAEGVGPRRTAAGTSTGRQPVRKQIFFSYRTTVSTKTEEKHSSEAKAVPTTAVEPIADRG